MGGCVECICGIISICVCITWLGQLSIYFGLRQSQQSSTPFTPSLYNNNYIQKLKKMNQIVHDTSSTKLQIQNHFQETIKGLTILRNFFLTQVDNKLRFIEFGQFDVLALKFIQQGKKGNTNLTDQIFQRIFESYNFHSGVKQDIQARTVQVLQSFKRKTQKILVQTLNQFQNMILKIKQQKQKSFKSHKEQTIRQKFVQIVDQQDRDQLALTFSSDIVNSQQLVKKLKKMFVKPPKSIRLLYKASRDSFEMSEYFRKCGDEQNTIIICKTQNNKIVGGYSPLSHSPTGQTSNSWVADYSRHSFIFSLSQNQKFPLKNYEYAIYHNKKKSSINFGNGFQILDHANQSYKNNFYQPNINMHYLNQKYKHNQRSYLKLTGEINHLFMVREWEVLKVEFL